MVAINNFILFIQVYFVWIIDNAKLTLRDRFRRSTCKQPASYLVFKSVGGLIDGQRGCLWALNPECIGFQPYPNPF